MPIRPEEIMITRNKEVNDAIRVIDGKIEVTLKKEFEGDNTVRVFLDDIPNNNNASVISEINAIYRQHGWSLSWGSHQIQGRWVDVTPLQKMKRIDTYA